MPVVVGIGGNNTMDVLDGLTSTNLSNIDGILSVVPYYNKPNQQGLYEHYKAIAQASTLPGDYVQCTWQNRSEHECRYHHKAGYRI